MSRVDNPATSGRRRWLIILPATVLGLLRAVPRADAQGTTGRPGVLPPDQPDAPTPRGFMDRAFAQRAEAEASGDQPYGAVVVQGDRIVGAAPSRVVVQGDPTAHAEMEAIRDAARRLGTRRLTGATLYSSSRPCPMCEAAAYWAGIDRMVHGTALSDGGAPRLCQPGSTRP